MTLQEKFKTFDERFNFGVSYSVFKNARGSDLDDFFKLNQIEGPPRLDVVSLWKEMKNDNGMELII
mgnify:CR=1 FL=1